MAGVTDVQMVTAACNSGIFGVHGVAYKTPEEIAKELKEIEHKTTAPYGINIFVTKNRQASEATADELIPARESLARFDAELSLTNKTDTSLKKFWQNYKEQLAAVEESETKPLVLSTTFGALSKEEIIELREIHPKIIIIGTATSVPEAIYLEQTGCDMIVAQGAESGGHRGTFLHDFSKGMVGTFALIPQVVNSVKIPVIAAGGIMDGKGIAAAISLGASGVSMGTVFLSSAESSIAGDYKKSLVDGRGLSTVVTSHYSGRPARTIANRFTSQMEGTPKASFPFQHSIAATLKKKAREEAPDLAMYLCGQGAPMSRLDFPNMSTIVDDLVSEYSDAVKEFSK